MKNDLRYEEASEAYPILSELVKSLFPDLANAKIKVFFDHKKKTDSGRLVFASIFKTDDLFKLLTLELDSEAADYCIIISKAAWKVATDEDKKRILRHELRHTNVDKEKKNPYGLIGHDIDDFRAEIELNKDDPNWDDRILAAIKGE